MTLKSRICYNMSHMYARTIEGRLPEPDYTRLDRLKAAGGRLLGRKVIHPSLQSQIGTPEFNEAYKNFVLTVEAAFNLHGSGLFCVDREPVYEKREGRPLERLVLPAVTGSAPLPEVTLELNRTALEQAHARAEKPASLAPFDPKLAAYRVRGKGPEGAVTYAFEVYFSRVHWLGCATIENGMSDSLPVQRVEPLQEVITEMRWLNSRRPLVTPAPAMVD